MIYTEDKMLTQVKDGIYDLFGGVIDCDNPQPTRTVTMTTDKAGLKIFRNSIRNKLRNAGMSAREITNVSSYTIPYLAHLYMEQDDNMQGQFTIREL